MLKRLFLAFLLCFSIACSPTANAAALQQMEAGVQLYNPMMGAVWSGVVVDEVPTSYGYDVMALTIIHDDPIARALIPVGAFPILGKIGSSGSMHTWRVVKWDSCSEVALISTVSERPVRWSPLGILPGFIGDHVTTVGNPLGSGLTFNKGYVGARGQLPQLCKFDNRPVTFDVYGSGTVPGQTGSAVYKNGNVIGLLTATALYPVDVIDENGEMIGETAVPVSNLGYYVPLSIIRRVLRRSEFL